MDWSLSPIVSLVAVRIKLLNKSPNRFQIAKETSTMQQSQTQVFINNHTYGVWLRLLFEVSNNWKKWTFKGSLEWVQIF